MNNNLLEMIQRLSKSDRKTLSQKALKATEEVGELAKATLPFDGAHGTNHRFSDRRAILEETADVVLCALSVAFELNYSITDIEEMMKEKSNKWAYLLNREEKFVGDTPYEIHVTVQADNLENFRSVCRAMDVKPIILDLQDKMGDTAMKDVMTSSVHLGDNKSAFLELERIAYGLERAGYKVIRKKVETVPWHPAAPQAPEDKMPKDCYFESHLAVICSEETRKNLQKLAERYDCHLSRNIFKDLGQGRYKIMLTYRRYEGTSPGFRHDVSVITKALQEEGFEVDKTIIEFSVYDTKVSHDSNWISKASQ